MKPYLPEMVLSNAVSAVNAINAGNGSAGNGQVARTYKSTSLFWLKKRDAFLINPRLLPLPAMTALSAMTALLPAMTALFQAF